MLIFCHLKSIRNISCFNCNGSLGGTVDERLVDTDSSAWDSTLAPRTDWDTILDGYKRGLDHTLNINVRKEIS